MKATMTNRLDVHDVRRVTKLTEWCGQNLKDNDWTIQVLRIYPAHYKFEFKDPHIATLAVLSS